jgi:hypothetical protein
MALTVPGIDPNARLAEPQEDISTEELRLASRNHAMPMEAIRWDATPAGLHYLLIHYDVHSSVRRPDGCPSAAACVGRSASAWPTSLRCPNKRSG